MRNTVAIYGIGLVVALIAAYFSWTGEDDREAENEDTVVVVDIKPDQLKSVKYEEDELTVLLEPRTDEHGEYVWAQTTRQKSAEPAPDPASHPHGPDAGDHPVEEPPAAPPTVEEKAFKTDSKGGEVIEAMAPFRAIRKLEGATKDRYESFGLDDPRGTLTLTYGDGKTRSFEVGGEGYGHRNIYVRDTASSDIFLVEANSIRPLRYADTRMSEKMLHGLSRNEITGLSISDGASRVDAEQKNRDDMRNRMWVPKGQELRNVPLETWVQKFERTRGTGYATADEAKQVDKVLTVKLEAEKGESTTIDLLRGQTAQGDPAWYVRSEFTRGVLKIPTALGADLANDFQTVVEAVNEPSKDE